MDVLDQHFGDRAGRLGEADETVDRLGEFRRAARPVPHLALDEAAVERPRPDRARDRGDKRARPGALRHRRVEHDQVGLAAKRRDGRREPADEGDVGGTLENIAARIVAGMDQHIGFRDAFGKCVAAHSLALDAAESEGPALQIGPAEVIAPLPVSARKPVLDAGTVGAWRRAEDAARPCPVATAKGGERVFRVVLVTLRNRRDRGVDQRDLGREHVTEQAGDAPAHVDARPAETSERQDFDPGDAAGRVIPLRPAAHQRQPLRDLLAAGPEAGAAPQVGDDVARVLAMLLQIAAHHLGRGLLPQRAGGRRRHGARI